MPLLGNKTAMQTTRTLRPKVTATILSASVLTLFLVSLSSFPQLLAATSTTSGGGAGQSLDAVQLSIQTKSLPSVSSYDLVAYNSTGVPVASYTGQYPQVTFDLPSGTYLFAANANGPASSGPPSCCVCAGSGVANPPAQSTKTSVSGTGGAAIAYPCYYSNPPVEYGYSLTLVSGPTALTIPTQPSTSIPTTNVSVSVSFKNGTAVSGAYVSTSVVGADFYWGNDPNVTMYAQTSANGVAQLVVPAAPLTVTASESVMVNLPKSQTTTQVNVGGQLVNVTIYYSPNYVYLSASALLVPPQTSLSMVVTAQAQPLLYPYAVGSAASGGAPTGVANGAATASPQVASTTSAGATATSSSNTSTTSAQLTTIPPIPASDLGVPAPASTQASSWISVSAIGILALAGAVAAIVGIAIAKARR
jgi:hypothetical protein